MTASVGSLASFHRHPVKSMSFSPDFAQHNEVRAGIYASAVRTGTIRIGDKLAVVR